MKYERVLWLGLLVWLVGCAAHPASTAPVLKVALVAPFEGNHRAVGYDAIYSARLAVREINEQGGIHGQRVALVALDDGGDPELAVQVAESLVQDTAVVAVIGHWQPETTQAAQAIYQQAGLPFIPLGQAPFGAFPPEQLPPAFVADYEAVTPFEETPGAYAGATYDALGLIWAALSGMPERDTAVRANLGKQLPNTPFNGITGMVYQP
ncbi:MAG: ABC transporter substrate-binding protein [Anaerolineales bacterium]|nr:ABC transporter substrate-binding protein [Anaerolineales bacterium]